MYNSNKKRLMSIILILVMILSNIIPTNVKASDIGLFTTEDPEMTNMWDFEYSEENPQQIFKVPHTGSYKIEVWGASSEGEDGENSSNYAIEQIDLDENDELFLHIGKQDSDSLETKIIKSTEEEVLDETNKNIDNWTRLTETPEETEEPAPAPTETPGEEELNEDPEETGESGGSVDGEIEDIEEEPEGPTPTEEPEILENTFNITIDGLSENCYLPINTKLNKEYVFNFEYKSGTDVLLSENSYIKANILSSLDNSEENIIKTIDLKIKSAESTEYIKYDISFLGTGETVYLDFVFECSLIEGETEIEEETVYIKNISLLEKTDTILISSESETASETAATQGYLGNGHIRITALNSVPILEATLKDSSVNRKDFTTITVEGSVDDSEYEDVVIKYFFDDEEVKEITSLTFEDYNFSETINIEELSSGEHTLNLYTEDILGRKSSIVSLNFTIITNNPSIELEEGSDISGLYNKNNVDNITGNLIVSDIDINDVVNIYYQLNSNERELIVNELSFEDEPVEPFMEPLGEEETIDDKVKIVEFNIPIKELSQESIHSVKFFAIDKYENRSNEITKPFNVIDSSKPILTINDTIEEFYNVNNEKILKIAGELKDEDIDDEITIKIYIDKNLVKEQGYNEFNESKAIIDIDLDISDLEEGTYNLEIIAEDSFGNKADDKFTKTIIVKKGEAPTNLTITNENNILDYYNLNNTSSINIEGSVSDVDINDTVYIKYYFKGKDGTTTSGIIVDDSEKEVSILETTIEDPENPVDPEEELGGEEPTPAPDPESPSPADPDGDDPTDPIDPEKDTGGEEPIEKINGYTLAEIIPEEDSSIGETTFERTVGLSPLTKYSDGEYILYIYAEDSFGKSYEPHLSYEFNKVNNVVPELKITTTLDDCYNYNNQKEIEINGVIKDEDINNKFELHYNFVSENTNISGTLTPTLDEKTRTEHLVEEVPVDSNYYKVDFKATLPLDELFTEEEAESFSTKKEYTLEFYVKEILGTDDNKIENSSNRVSFEKFNIKNNEAPVISNVVISGESSKKEESIYEFNLNNKRDLTITGNIQDEDKNDKITYEYYFNELNEETEFYNLSVPISEDLEVNTTSFTGTINLTKELLSEGEHTITLYAVDRFGNESNRETFDLNIIHNTKPIVNVEIIDVKEYYNTNNKDVLRLSAGIKDVDIEDIIYINVFSILNEEEIEIFKQEIRSETGQPIDAKLEIDIELTDALGLEEGLHTIKVKITDEYGKELEGHEVEGITLREEINIIKNKSPEDLVINNNIEDGTFSEYYNLHNTEKVSITGSVFDEDINDTVYIKYYFEGKEGTETADVIANGLDSKDYTLTTIIPTDNPSIGKAKFNEKVDLSPLKGKPDGSYILYFYAIDSFNNKCEFSTTYEFKKVDNVKPELKIDTVFETQYNANNNPTISIFGKIKDEDKEDKIAVYFEFYKAENGTESSKIKSYTIEATMPNDDTGSLTLENYKLPISELTSNTDFEKFVLKIYAIDSNKNESGKIVKRFEIKANEKPVLEISEETIIDSYYNINNVPSIDIKGLISDGDINDEINVKYYFKKTEDIEENIVEYSLLDELIKTGETGLVENKSNFLGTIDLAPLKDKPDGSYTLYFYAIDKFDNESELIIYEFEKANSVVPVLTIDNDFEEVYNYNNVKGIPITGNIVDEDTNNKFELHYRFISNDGEAEKAGTLDFKKEPERVFSEDSTEYKIEFNETLSLDELFTEEEAKSFSTEKEYTLKFYVKEILGTGDNKIENSSDVVSFNDFKVKNNEKPILEIINIDDIISPENGFYNNNNVPELILKGNISDEDLRDKVSIEIIINKVEDDSSKFECRKIFNENLANKGIDETFEGLIIPIKELESDGVYNITIYAIDMFGNKSDNIYKKSIEILVGEAPTDLTITTEFESYYNLHNLKYKNTNVLGSEELTGTKKIKVDGTVSDVDSEDSIDIFYYFTRNGEKVLWEENERLLLETLGIDVIMSENNEILLDTISTNSSTNNEFEFSGFIDLGLLESKMDEIYTLHFYAKDKFDKESKLSSYSFNKVNNVIPELSITTELDDYYNSNNTPNISIEGNIVDEDIGQVDIYYFIKDMDTNNIVIEDTLLTSVQVKDDSKNPILFSVEKFDITKLSTDIGIKNYKIKFYAKDGLSNYEGMQNISKSIETESFMVEKGQAPTDLTITNKNTILNYYNLNNTPTINIKGSFNDKDFNDVVRIMYYFTKGDEKVLLEDQELIKKDIIDSDLRENRKFDFEEVVNLELLKDKPDGNYTLHFYAIDKFNKEDILEDTFTFNKVNNVIPELSITTEFGDDYYNYNNQEYIEVNGFIIDEDIEDDFTLYYNFVSGDTNISGTLPPTLDEKTRTEYLAEEVPVDSNYYKVDFSAALPLNELFTEEEAKSGLMKKTYEVNFFIKDSLTAANGIKNKSNTEEKSINIKNNEKPILSIEDTLNSEFYNRNNVEKLTLSGTITDEDNGDRITVQVFVDGNLNNSKVFNEEELSNVKINKDFNIDVIIKDLKEGTHEIEIKAVDKFNNESVYVYEKTLEILVGETPTDLTITTEFENYYNLHNLEYENTNNSDDESLANTMKIRVDGTVSDVDYKDTIKVMYYFEKDDGTTVPTDIVLESYTLELDSPITSEESAGLEDAKFSGTIDLAPLKDKPDGKYTLHFYAVDKFNKEDILEDTFTFNKVNNVIPTLTITNKFDDYYNSNNTPNISIEGNIVDEDNGNKFELYYEFIGGDSQVKKSGELKFSKKLRTKTSPEDNPENYYKVEFKAILPLEGLSTTLNKENYTLNFFIKEILEADEKINKSNTETFDNFKVKSNEAPIVKEIMVDDGDSDKTKHEFNLNNKRKLFVSGNIQDEDIGDLIIYKYYFDNNINDICDLNVETVEPLEISSFAGTIKLTRELLDEGKHTITLYAIDSFENESKRTTFNLTIVHSTTPKFIVNNEKDIPSYLNLSNNFEIPVMGTVLDKDNRDNVKIIYSFTDKDTGKETDEFELYNEDIQVVGIETDLDTEDIFNFEETITLVKSEDEMDIEKRIIYLPEGTYTLNIYAIDNFGNKAVYELSKEIKIEFDTAPILSDLSVDSTSHHIDEELIVYGKLKDVDNGDDNTIYYSFVDNNKGKKLVKSTGDISNKIDNDLYGFKIPINLDEQGLNTDGKNPIKTFTLYVWSVDTLGNNKSNVLTKDITITFNTIQQIKGFEEDNIDDMMMMDVEGYNVSWIAAEDREGDSLEYELSVVYYTKGSTHNPGETLKKEVFYTEQKTQYSFTPDFKPEYPIGTVSGEDVYLVFKVKTIDKNKYGPLTSEAKISKEISYEVNTSPEILGAELDLGPEYNGGIFANEELQAPELKFKIKDADGHGLDYEIYATDVNDERVSLEKGRFEESTKDGVEITYNLNNLNDLINNDKISTGSISFGIIINDNRPAGEKAEVLAKTKENKQIYLWQNKPPNMKEFCMEFHDATKNHIYDKLMTSQNEGHKPKFLWEADNIVNGVDEALYGDEIVSFKLEYSVDGGKNYNDVENLSENLSGDASKKHSWMNNTGYDNTRVIFKLTATDTFGETSSLIYPSTANNDVYLQVNNEPRKPLSLVITNTSSSRIYKGNSYNFSWGISSEQDALDAVVAYRLGYYAGDSRNVTYENIKEIYKGTNLYYNGWEHNVEEEGTITFVVYATDKFGVNSEIQTFVTTSLNNSPPHKTTLTERNFSDASSNTLSNNNFLKKGENYSVVFDNAGDPNESAGDYVKQWDLQYQVATGSENLIDGNWKTLTTSVRNNITFNVDSINFSEFEDRVYFRIVAFDTSDLQTPSDPVFFKCVSDIEAPVWENPEEVDSGIGYRTGKTSNFKIRDNSNIKSVEIYSSGIRLVSLYQRNNNLRTLLDVDYVFTSNGTYTLRLVDIYENVNEYIFTITGIDTIAPNLTILPEIPNEKLTNNDYYININISDNDTGLKELIIKDSSKEEDVIIKYDSLTKTDKIEYLVSENSSITASVYDNAENFSTRSYVVSNINKIKPVIYDDYNDEELANRRVIINLSVDVLDNGQIPLGQWKVHSNESDSYIFKTTNISQTEATLTATKNSIITLSFTDIWGNISDEKIINVNNILDGKIETNTSYLITEKDYFDYASKNELPIDNISTVIIDDINYVVWDTTIEATYDIYAYIEINERYADRASFDERLNPSELIKKNGTALLYKFAGNEQKSFYIKDTFGNYSIVRVALTTYKEEAPVVILEPIILDAEKTKGSVRVFFEVKDGLFQDNPDYYTYRDSDGNEINIYNNFKWATLDENSEPVYSDEYKGKSFIYEFTANQNIRIWASNENETNWTYRDIFITNIDNIPPMIEIEEYETEQLVANEITVTARTDDKFVSKEVLRKKINYKDELSFDIDNYYVSEDGKIATITFTENMNSVEVFYFLAIDDVGNETASDTIFIKNIYNPKLNIDIYYLNNETNSWMPLTQEVLDGLYTNQDFKVKAISTDGMFYKEDNLGSNIEEPNFNVATYTFTKDESYTFIATDEYGYKIEKTIVLADNINKELPKINSIVEKIIDVENTGYSIGAKIILTTNNKSSIIYNDIKYENSHILEVSENGIYTFSAIDIYGNENIETVIIDFIFKDIDKPEIIIGDYEISPTNENIEIKARVINGKFINIPDGAILDETKTVLTYSFEENGEISIFAINYYENESSIVERNILISNIDKTPPHQPLFIESLDGNGQIVFHILDDGDDGLGLDYIEYSLRSKEEGGFSETRIIKNRREVKLANPENIPNYSDGLYEVSLIAYDKAGNVSVPYIREIEIYNGQAYQFMETYNAAVKQIKSSELTDDLKDFYLNVVSFVEGNLDSLMNESQKYYIGDKTTLLRNLIHDAQFNQERLIEGIEGYFTRLEIDIYDNSFMDELKILINSVNSDTKKAEYIKRYEHYEYLIGQTFIDTTSEEFSYIDDLGNTINPLSGYVINKKGETGYYDELGNFVKGKNEQLYYYTYNGKSGGAITLDPQQRTYVDKLMNIVNTNTGLVNFEFYYNKLGELITEPFDGGFYDFQGIWHNRGLPEPEPIEEEPTDPVDPGEEDPGGEEPTPTPDPENPSPTGPGGDDTDPIDPVNPTNPTPTPKPGDEDKDPVDPTKPTPTPKPGEEDPINPTPTPKPGDNDKDPTNPTPTPKPGEDDPVGPTKPTPTPKPGEEDPTRPTPKPGDNDKDPANPTPTPKPGEEDPTRPTPTPKPGEKDKDKVPVSSVKLNKNNVELRVGDTYKLQASVSPSNATDKSLHWKSSDTSIASISNSGTIKALKTGRVLITVESINNVKASCIIVIRDSNSSGTNNDIIIVESKPRHPSINDLFATEEEIKNMFYPPEYIEGKLGKQKVAITQSTNLNTNNLNALFAEGHSTLIYNGFTTINLNEIRNSKVDIGIGNNKTKALMSYKDINSLENIRNFKLNVNNNKTILYINNKADKKLSLGRNSKLILFSSYSADKIITLDGNSIKAEYDKDIGGYIVKNPKSGTYLVSQKSKELSSYRNIIKYNFIDNIYNENLTYRNIYVMSYNALNLDSHDKLYSNIDESSNIYREISILQRQGIVEKNASNLNNNITGKEAYDIIYLTLSNVLEESLNYNIKDYSKLETITLRDLDNIIQNITK